MINVLCPNPACGTTYELKGLLDLGFLAETGFPQGITEATLGVDCPACSMHLDIRWTATWRSADAHPGQ